MGSVNDVFGRLDPIPKAKKIRTRFTGRASLTFGACQDGYMVFDVRGKKRSKAQVPVH